MHALHGRRSGARMFPHSPTPTRELIGFLSQQGKRPPIWAGPIRSVQHGAAAPVPGKRTTNRRKAHNASRKIAGRDKPALQIPVATEAIYLVPTFSRLSLAPSNACLASASHIDVKSYRPKLVTAGIGKA